MIIYVFFFVDDDAVHNHHCQEPSVGINCEELFMFQNDEGWYISNKFSPHGGDTEKPADDQLIAAWGKPMKGHPCLPPAKWHVPYWSKKPLAGVDVEDLVAWQDRQIAIVSADLATLSGVGCSGGGGGDEPPGGPVTIDEPDPEDGKGGKDKGKGKTKSGWLNKSAALAAAVITEEH